ncbi:ASCH domain-containing protein [Tissierella praeacuta]|uniref:ASCH domain-containing protein n=1 Tax=Tissierella praeacuta TaxID=43131 RepID=UPI0033424919
MNLCNAAVEKDEGDKFISYWRKVHKDFFSRELKAYDLDFDEKMIVVCEEFKVIFSLSSASWESIHI